MNLSARTLAVLAMVIFAVGAPLMKSSQDNGLSPRDFVFVSCVCGIMVALFWPGQTAPMFASMNSLRPVLLGVAAGILLNVAYQLEAFAFAAKGGLLSQVVMIISLNPIMASIIGIILLNELSRIMPLRWTIGAILMAAGAIIISYSNK